MVWIAESIQADHRAAVDWLNAALEGFHRDRAVLAAPRFNMVASPNDWARETRTAVRRLEAPEWRKASV